MSSMTRLRRNSRFDHAFQPESADRAAAQMIISAAIDGKEKAAVHYGNLRRSPAPSLRVVARHQTILATRQSSWWWATPRRQLLAARGCAVTTSFQNRSRLLNRGDALSRGPLAHRRTLNTGNEEPEAE